MDILGMILILKIILAVVAIGSLIFLVFAGCSIYTNLTSSVPWVKTPAASLKKIFREISLPKGTLIYDLGCGDGRVLFMAEKQGCRGLGYELSPYPYLKAWLKKIIIHSAVRFKRRDFFEEDLSPADVIFVFLVGKVMDKAGKKLKGELKKGTLVISYGFTIPGWQIDRTILTKPSLTYVYKIY